MNFINESWLWLTNNNMMINSGLLFGLSANENILLYFVYRILVPCKGYAVIQRTQIVLK